MPHVELRTQWCQVSRPVRSRRVDTIEEVSTNTYLLGTRGHNFYVLRDGDEVTVIDAGCSREWPKLVDGLAELGLQPASVRAVVATHSHADHFGFAKQAGAKGVPVSVHSDEETRALGTYEGRYAVSATELPMYSLATWRNFLPMMLAGVMSFEHPKSVATFSDGERLDVPGHPVVVHTPGHTEGHCMFHVPDLGLLFSGDGLVTMDLLGTGTGPQMLERRFHLDEKQARESLDRIVDLPADTILPGHGRPWRGSPADAVAAARRS